MNCVLIYAGKGGISSQTIITIVVPTVVSVGIFYILCYCFISRKAKKKYNSTEEEKGEILIPDPKDPLFLVVAMLFTIYIQQIC